MNIDALIRELQSLHKTADLSDLGNILGMFVYLHVDHTKLGYTPSDFSSGFNHGRSLIDGTHYKEQSIVNIKDLIKDKVVNFDYYRAGNLWYKTQDGFSFPVPIEDTGEATFPATEKAIFFMRYIRKHIEEIKHES